MTIEELATRLDYKSLRRAMSGEIPLPDAKRRHIQDLVLLFKSYSPKNGKQAVGEAVKEDTDFGSDPRSLLRRRREELGMSRQELAKRTRFKAVYIADVEEARVRPQEKFLRKVAKILDLPLEDLMGGSDQPPLTGEGITFGSTPRTKLTAGLDARTIPLISMAQAGEMRSYEDLYDYEGVIDYAAKGPKTFAVRIRGDSMTPPFPEGTVAIVEPEREIRTEKLVIVKLTNGSVLFKQLQIQGDSFRLISFNPLYAPIAVPQREVEWIYRVVRTQHDHE